MTVPLLLPTKPDALGSNRDSRTLLAGGYNIQSTVSLGNNSAVS